MRLGEFETRDVISGVLLFAVGIGLLAAGLCSSPLEVVAIVSWLGFITIGAGCGAPFQAKTAGAILGSFCGMVTIAGFFVYLLTAVRQWG